MTTGTIAIKQARDKENTVAVSATEGKIPTGLWSIMRPVHREIIIAMVLAAVSTCTELASLLLVPAIFALLLPDAMGREYTWILLGVAIASVFATFLIRAWAFYVSHSASFKLEEYLRTRIATHLARVPLGYVITTGSGAIKKIVQDDVRALHAFVADSTPLISRGIISPILTAIALFIIDWRLALAALVILPIGMVVMRLAMHDYVEQRRNFDQSNERINVAVIEFVQGMQVVRTFDDGSSSFKRYQQALDSFSHSLSRWIAASDVHSRLARLLLASLPTILVVLAVGSWLIAQGTLTFPVLLACLFISTGIIEALTPMMWLTHFMNRSNAAAQRICSVLAEPLLPQPEHPRQPCNTTVIFRDVTFTYKNRERSALEHINLTLSEGTVTALVGPSGAGKTTLAQLLPRFWDIDTGSIEIGGIDIRQMTSETLLRHVAFVFQDTFLFHDSIRENIRLGRPGATDTEVEEAARIAQAHDFILTLPTGYDTIAGERGTRLSGGERQRITLARAILQNCPIIVLDEAMAFADPENEAAIQIAISRLTVGKTLLVIAHRLSTIKDADQIVILDTGKIVEQGEHDQLVAANGLYARLWSHYLHAQNWVLRSRSTKTHVEKDEN